MCVYIYIYYICTIKQLDHFTLYLRPYLSSTFFLLHSVSDLWRRATVNEDNTHTHTHTHTHTYTTSTYEDVFCSDTNLQRQGRQMFSVMIVISSWYCFWAVDVNVLSSHPVFLFNINLLLYEMSSQKY